MNDDLIDKLWENSNHGTRREDVVAAYLAGVNEGAKERDALRGLLTEARERGILRAPSYIVPFDERDTLFDRIDAALGTNHAEEK
jgi:hypothetical protein